MALSDEHRRTVGVLAGLSSLAGAESSPGAAQGEPDGHSVWFAYPLLSRVEVQPLKLAGTVLARCERPGGIHEYRVVWWADGKRFDDWLLASDLRGFWWE